MAQDDRVDRLFGLPPGAFVGERDALAKALRAERRREEAAAVKALPKPTVAAWAVNQAVRSQPRDARELWSAGDALAAAQEAVVAGRGSGADLRSAAEAERGAVEALVEAARGLLDDRGRELSETTLERVRATLHAAAVDPQARETVAAGRAERELEPPGLGGFGTAAAAPPAAPRARAADPEPAPKRAKAPAPSKADAKAKAAAEREAAAERRRVERDRRAATRRVEQAQAALEKAQEAVASAAARLEDARDREAEASEALDEARAALDALE
jgi:hypothetical protein